MVKSVKNMTDKYCLSAEDIKSPSENRLDLDARFEAAGLYDTGDDRGNARGHAWIIDETQKESYGPGAIGTQTEQEGNTEESSEDEWKVAGSKKEKHRGKNKENKENNKNRKARGGKGKRGPLGRL